MIGDDEATMGLLDVSEYDMAAPLAVNLVAKLPKGRDGFASGNAREFAHTATSTSSSPMGGGIGSPRC